MIWKKRPGQLSNKIIVLHDNTCPHMAKLMKMTLETIGWEIMTHPPYSPDLAPSEPMKVHLGQKFQTDDKLKMMS
jgi:transposase